VARFNYNYDYDFDLSPFCLKVGCHSHARGDILTKVEVSMTSFQDVTEGNRLNAINVFERMGRTGRRHQRVIRTRIWTTR